MSQDPNAKVAVDASEIGANAAETGERDLSHHTDVVDDHEIVEESPDFHALAEHGHYRALFSSETPRPVRSWRK